METGRFLRNLKKNEVGYVYSEEPGYGYRLKGSKVQKWSDIQGQRGVSANLFECVRSAECSILVHPDADQFHHVWEIELDVLNAYLNSAGDRFVAQYKPEANNKCHFELISSEGVINPTQLLLLLGNLERAFPPAEKDPPKGKRPPPGREREAQDASTVYHDLVRIHYDPLGKLI